MALDIPRSYPFLTDQSGCSVGLMTDLDRAPAAGVGDVEIAALGNRVASSPALGSVPGGAVQLVGLEKHYGDEPAVRGIDLEIAGGEFFSLLGPSGCGKTTTLRMIGGFERPTGGRILLDGEDMSATPPERRPVNTVFQSYALFPHLDVRANVGFGLRFADVSRQDARRLVEEALELVQLGEFAARRPNQLSGGQQQRVALARALVLRPRVLLLDEPLGALDAKLRKALQRELTALQREVGITFVYVTHDQEEALTMSDRLAVMSNGRVEQCGSPRDVYERPSSAFVAAFLGVANLIPGVHAGRDRVDVGGWTLTPGASSPETFGLCHVVVRPERVRLSGPGRGGANAAPGRVTDLVYLGPVTHARVALDQYDVELEALLTNDGSGNPLGVGDAVDVDLPPEAVHVITGPPEDVPADDQADLPDQD
jgi:spermidine/putrescine transport system ATP-binding protein